MQFVNKLLKIFVLVFVLSIDTNMLGQEYKEMLDNIFLPTPNAMSMMRYGEIPVSYSTGVPDITIPLYTIECDGYKLPISISYHASGIKVDDIATSVGLGWTLNAGGQITRCGISANDNLDGYCIKDASEWEVKSPFVSLMGCDSLLRMLEGKNPYYDTESDRYSYILPTKSGVFRQDIQTDEYFAIPYDPIIIKSDSVWKITDTDGTLYMFNDRELSDNNNKIGEITGYCLSEIKTPSRHQSIKFKYETHQYSLITGSERYTDGKLAAKEKFGMEPYLEPFSKYLYLNKFVENLVSEIEWNGNGVIFEYKEDRSDSPGITSGQMKRLSKMTVIDSKGNEIKKITFHKKELGNRKENYRTLLASVIIDDELYSFDYNMGMLPPYNKSTLSGSLQCHSDFWGYYNGNTSEHFLPQVNDKSWLLQNRSMNLEGRKFAGKNKEPNEYYAQYGILKSIHYPTGGSVEFEYEGNETNDPSRRRWGGLRIKKIVRRKNGKVQNYELYKYEQDIPPITINEELFWSEREIVYFFFEPFGGEPATITKIGNTVFVDYCSGGDDGVFFTEGKYHTICESSSAIPIYGWHNAPIFYARVTKSLYNGEHEIEKESVYEYEPTSLHGNYWVENYLYPRIKSFYSQYDQGPKTPILKKETDTYYLNGKVSYSSVENTYKEIKRPQRIVGVKVNRTSDWVFEDLHFTDDIYRQAWAFESLNTLTRGAFRRDWIFYNVYGIENYFVLASSTEERDGLLTQTEYSYDSLERTLRPLTEITKRVGCDTVEKRFAYPFQSNDPVLKSMYMDNYVDLIVGESVLEGGVISSKSRDLYKMENERYLLSEKQYALGNNPLETRLKLANYDSRGNIWEIVRDGDSHVFLVWGYNYQYPIMKIECPVGKDADCREYLRNKVESIGASIVPDEKSVKEIRDYMEGKGSLVVTYQYKPLVGLTEVIDEKGIRTFYRYDSHNRLSAIHDAEGKMIESYKYNYKKQEYE